MEAIEVVRGSSLPGLKVGVATDREMIFESASAVVARFSIQGRTLSSWHHHAKRTLVGYLLSGRLQIEVGEPGGTTISLSPGDAFRVPPGLVHRDSTLDSSAGASVLSVYLGDGPLVVDVGAQEAVRE